MAAAANHPHFQGATNHPDQRYAVGEIIWWSLLEFPIYMSHLWYSLSEFTGMNSPSGIQLLYTTAIITVSVILYSSYLTGGCTIAAKMACCSSA